MTEEQKAFKEWLANVDLGPARIRNYKQAIEYIWTQGYHQGRRDELHDCLRCCDFCNQRLLELQDTNLELLAELAAKNIEKKD